MARLLITNVAICATALLAVYCTTFEFNNPFDPDNKHTLTVNSNLTAGGAVSPTGTSIRSGGERVVVTAAAAAGYAFMGWSGAVLSTTSSVTIIMDGNKTLMANFSQIQIQHTLYVDRNPAAGGTVTVNGSTYTNPTTHNIGASVTVRAVPSSGYVFTGWEGASTSTDSEISVTMSDNRTLTANFQIVGTTSTFKDSRDGQTYGTIVMPDGKAWMSENLNCETANSWCYDNNASNCDTYGRLYTWDAAIMVACPVGWRLPTRGDWNALVNAAGGSSTAGNKLKSSSPAWNGTDNFGFSALPGGGRWGDGNFGYVGSYGLWWTATEDGSSNAYSRDMGSDGVGVWEGWNLRSYGFSVRCVRD